MWTATPELVARSRGDKPNRPVVKLLGLNASGASLPSSRSSRSSSCRRCPGHGATSTTTPPLPSLRSLTLDTVAVEAPFPPGSAWCPLLEDLCISVSEIELSRVDIRLPRLKILEMDDVNGPLGDLTVDAPELEELDVSSTVGCGPEYESFKLRAPQLRCLRWRNQFAERVDIDVGRLGGATSGRIEFMWNAWFQCREMKDCRALMMRMLERLLPELPWEAVAEVARPYMTLKKYTVDGFDGGERLPEKLTCDLGALMH